jgi:uncharacterized membrane protein
MTDVAEPPHNAPLSQEEHVELKKLRWHRRLRRKAGSRSVGQVVSDGVAAAMGSWPFILTQTAILVAWIVLNVCGWISAWDPYPFILLNLALSFQAAYAAPFIMMSQNRQSEIDRKRAIDDYEVNCKAELEIELLHEKMDLLRQQEISRLTEIIEALTAKLDAKGA